MFRIGGSAGGITSGMRRGYALGGSGSEREILELKKQIQDQPSVEEEADLTVASESEEVDETEQTRASLRDWVDSYVFNK